MELGYCGQGTLACYDRLFCRRMQTCPIQWAYTARLGLIGNPDNVPAPFDNDHVRRETTLDVRQVPQI